MGQTSSLLPNEKRCMYTNWGRGALEAALNIEGLQSTSVMLPAFICQKSLEPLFRRHNITPRFVDIDPDTFQMKHQQANEYIEEVTAVILVHPFGYPVSTEPWVKLCEDHNIALIEDCVRALGAKSGGTLVGTEGDYAIYSLPKVSSFEKGGILATKVADTDKILQPPTYDGRTLYHLLPKWIQNELSVTYPLDVIGRELDDFTREKIQESIQAEFSHRLDENQKKHP